MAYGRRSVLHDISFTAEPGQLISVLGPNGVGKSTMFKCILRLLTEYSGIIQIDGEDIRGLTQQQMAQRIAFIPQSHYPTFNYSVRDMVLMGTAHHIGVFATPGSEEIRLAEDAMERVGINELVNRGFQHLSGGEQQLVVIARALAQQTSILVMDEPTSNLDFGNQIHVMRQIQKLSRLGYTILLSTHNPQYAMTFSDRILAMHGGTVIADGNPEEVMTEALLEKLYGVRVCFVETEKGKILVPSVG